LLLLLSLLL